jgi:hypothetical protein
MSKKSKLLLNNNKKQFTVPTQEHPAPSTEAEKIQPTSQEHTNTAPKAENTQSTSQEHTNTAPEAEKIQEIYHDPDLRMKINSIYDMLSSGSSSAPSIDSSTEIKISTCNTTEKPYCSEEKKERLTKIFSAQKALSYIYQNYLEINALANAAKTIKEHIAQQRNLEKNKEITFSTSASRILKTTLNQNAKTEIDYLKLQISTKKLLASTLNLRSDQEYLKDISNKSKEDCISETCFDESDLIRNVCGALKYGNFFEDSDS